LDFLNIVILVVFIISVALIALILSKHSYDIQGIVITALGVIAFFVSMILLHFFKKYFVKQWYYLNIYNYIRGNRESIIVPFIFIGMIVYWITQKIVLKVSHKK